MLFPKPSISTHSKRSTRHRTRGLRCFVLEHSVLKTKHLRRLIRAFEWLEILSFSEIFIWLKLFQICIELLISKLNEFQYRISNFDNILITPRLYKIGLFLTPPGKAMQKMAKSDSTPGILTLKFSHAVPSEHRSSNSNSEQKSEIWYCSFNKEGGT